MRHLATTLLGPRLAVVASYVPEGARLGDIGTDHAYLPVTLCEQGKISSAVAIDVHQGPYESALSAVQSRGLQDKIAVRLGDGLSPLGTGEVDTLVLAGMGGNTMMEILSARPEIVADASDLIVQPQGAEGKVRRSLLAQDWLLRDEVLVEEESRIYVVMVYAKGQGCAFRDLSLLVERWVRDLTEHCLEQEGNEVREKPAAFQEAIRTLVWQLGPLVLTKPNLLLRRELEEKISELSRRLEEMKKAKSPGTLERVKDTVMERFVYESLLEYLFA